MNWEFLGVAAVKLVHSNLIDVYGGSHGLRDAGLLESAVARAENKAAYDPDATLATVAASLAYGLIKNHAFIDGNKRIGLAALLDTLEINGWTLDVHEEVARDMVRHVAASEVTEAEWTAWVNSMARSS